jgi:type II secretory pathway component PulK
VLLAVLIVIVLLSLAAYKYNDWMQAEARAADSGVRADQARAFAASGVHYAAAMLAAEATSGALNNNPWDNAQYFQHVPVPTGAENARTGRFSVISVRAPDETNTNGTPFRYGVTCEAGKVNVNALLLLDNGKGDAGKKILMGLPNMAAEIADAILDWIDPDETARENGAENQYYSAANPPYRCKNGPLDSLEELLLVKGVTPQLLFGNDRNRNGVIDADEGDGESDLGWQAYLTVYSREVNVGEDNLPRIHLNNKDLQGTIEKLKAVVPEEMCTYIAAARLYGTSGGSSSRGGSSTGSGGGAAGGSGGGGGSGGSGGGGRTGGSQTGGGGGGSGGSSGGGAGSTTAGSTASASSSPADIEAAKAKVQEDIASSANRRLRNIASLWDLVGTSVSVTVGTGQQQRTVTYPSPMQDKDLDKQRELMPKLWQYATTSNNMDLTPRININTAPQAVLASLKEVAGLTDDDVTLIQTRRPQPDSIGGDEVFSSPVWLLTEANLSVAKVKRLDPYITTRSQVYRMQVLGYFDQGGPVARVEAVVDTNQGKPRVVYFRDISELGKGFDVGSAE